MQEFNFSLKDSDRVANLIIPFAAFVAKKNELCLSTPIAEVLFEANVPNAVKEFINTEGAKWGKCSLESFEKVTVEDIKTFISDKILEWNESLGAREWISGFPNSLNILCSKVLDIQEGDSVLDMGAGLGTFVIHVAKNYSCKKIVGIDINHRGCLFASILTYIEGVKPEIIFGDALAIDEKQPVDKLLTFPPLNSEVTVPFINKATKLISEKGRAVIYLHKGFLNSENLEYKAARRYLVEAGLLEAVIELAAGVLYPFTAVQTVMLVLSHNNQKVRFVNASSISENTRRGQSVLTDDGTKQILTMLKEEGSNSKAISLDTIKEKDFTLVSSAYLLEEKLVLPGVKQYAKLSELVETKIQRGAQIKASDLEALESGDDTGNYYALAKDIQDNRLGGELKSLKQIDKKLESLILKDGDILLVMIVSDSLKLACIEGLENRKIIPASNMYILRPNKNKLEPLYLKMLLETDGAAQLFNAFSGGTALRAVSADFLNKLQIPVPPLEVQKKLAEKYAGIETQRELLKKQLESLADQKSRILDDLKEPNL